MDASADLVEQWRLDLTHVVQVDATSESAMRQLGAAEFNVAVVAIGHDVEASLLSTGVLVDLGVREVWAKAITPAHGRILERTGAKHVIYPELEAGERTAHLLTGRMIDYIEFDDGYAVVKLRAPREAWRRTLGESALHTKYGIELLGVKRRGEDFTYARPELYVREGDLLIVSGSERAVERFAAAACES